MPAFPSYPPGNLPEDVELVGPVTEAAEHPRRPGGARRKARRRAVDVLFESEARDADPLAVIAERTRVAAADASAPPVTGYTVTMVTGVAENVDRIDDVIASHLREWRLERLPAVDRAILRVAVWELLHNPDVPPAVAVDEAVELTKQLSNEASPDYVNGVLGQVAIVAPQVRAAAAAVARPQPADPPDEPPAERTAVPDDETAGTPGPAGPVVTTPATGPS